MPCDTHCEGNGSFDSPLPETKDLEVASSAVQLPPCKLLSLLAVEPRADITQLPTQGSEIDNPELTDGVECSKAYRMLMQFATTESKLNTISHALESGCIANEGSRGGCRVRNKAMWEAIDHVS